MLYIIFLLVVIVVIICLVRVGKEAGPAPGRLRPLRPVNQRQPDPVPSARPHPVRAQSATRMFPPSTTTTILLIEVSRGRRIRRPTRVASHPGGSARWTSEPAIRRLPCADSTTK